MSGTTTVQATLYPSLVIPGSFTVKIPTYFQEKYTINVYPSASNLTSQASLIVDFTPALPAYVAGKLPVLSRSISGLTPGSVYYITITQSTLAPGQTPFSGYVKLASQMAIPQITSVAPSTTSSGVIDVTFPKHPQDNSFTYYLQAFAVSSVNGQTVISQSAAFTGTAVAFSNNVPNPSLMKLSTKSVTTTSLTAGSLYQIRLIVKDGSNQVVWNTIATTDYLPANASGTTSASSLVTSFISNYANNSSNIVAPYQINFPSSTVVLPYATNTSASTSITLTSFPTPSTGAPGQQFIVYALDTSVALLPSLLDDLKAAQSGSFTGSLFQSTFNALPQSSPTTSTKNVTVQNLDVTKTYKFAVIALPTTGYITGGFIDDTTTLSGIKASSQAIYVSSAYATNNFTLTYSFTDASNTYTTAPVIKVTATQSGGNGATPITVSSSVPLTTSSSTQTATFTFPVASSQVAGSLQAGTFYNFVANVSGGVTGQTGNPLTGGSSVIGSVSVSSLLLAPCPFVAPTLAVQNSATVGSLDFTISDATPGLEPTVNYTLYYSTTASNANPTALPQTTLIQGTGKNTISIYSMTNITAGSSYFFFVKYTGGQSTGASTANTYSNAAPYSTAPSSSFFIPVVLPAVTSISFSDPTVANAITVGFNSTLDGALTADKNAISVANNNYTKFTSTLSQAAPVPWLSELNLPYLSSQLTSSSLTTASPATSALTLSNSQADALKCVDSNTVSTFIAASQAQLQANLNVWTAYNSFNTAANTLKTDSTSTNTDTTGLWLLKNIVSGLVVPLTSGVVTNNQPFYKTVAQIMASLATVNTNVAFSGTNNIIYQSLLTKQSSQSPYTDTFTMLDNVVAQLTSTNAPVLSQALANYAVMKTAVTSLQTNVSNSATPVSNFNSASLALSNAYAASASTLSPTTLQQAVEVNYLMTIMYNVAISSTPYPTTANWFLAPALPTLSAIVSAVNQAYASAATNLAPTYQVQLSTAFATPQIASVINVPSANIAPVYKSTAPPSGTTNDSALQVYTDISGYTVANFTTSLVAGNSYFAQVVRVIPSGFTGAYVPSSGNALLSTPQKAIPSVQPGKPTNVTIQPSTSAEGVVTVNYGASASAGSNAQYTVSMKNLTTSPNQTSTYVTSSSASCNITGLVKGNNYQATVSVNATVGVYSGTLKAPTIASGASSSSATFMAPMKVPNPVALVEATADLSTGIKAYTYNPYLTSSSTPYQIIVVFNPNWSGVPKQSDLQNQTYSATFTGLVNPTTTQVPVQTFSASSCTSLLGGNIQWTFIIPSAWFVNGSATRTLSNIVLTALPQSGLNYLQNTNTLTISPVSNPPMSAPSASSISVSSLQIISGIVNFAFSVPASMVAGTAKYPKDDYHPLNAATNDYWSGPQTFTLSLLNQTAPSAAPIVFNTAQTTVTPGTPPVVQGGSMITNVIAPVNGISYVYYTGSFPSSTVLTGGNTYILKVSLDASFGNLAPAPYTCNSLNITGINQLLQPQLATVQNIVGKAGAITVSWQIPSTSYNYQILVTTQNGDFQNSYNSLVPGQNGLLPIPNDKSNMYSYDIFLYESLNNVVVNANNPLIVQIFNIPVNQSDIQSNPAIINDVKPLLLLGKATDLNLAYDDATPSLSFNPPVEADGGVIPFSYKVLVKDTATLLPIFSSIISSTNSADSPITVYILGSNGRGLLQRKQSYEAVVISNYSGSDCPSNVVPNSAYTNSWTVKKIDF